MNKEQTISPEGCPFVFLKPERLVRVQARWTKLRKAGREEDWENRFLLNNSLVAFHRKCKRAGIPEDEKLTLHCLRKSYAQNLADLGTPQPTLKVLMGHSSISTTDEFYLKSTDANQQAACDALDRLMNGTDAKLTPEAISNTSGKSYQNDKSLAGHDLKNSG